MVRLLLLLGCVAGLGLSSGCMGNCKPGGSPEGQPLGFMAQYAADVCLSPAGGPGLAVAITGTDGTLGLGATGTMGAGVPADPQGLFRLGAVSEVYTAALVARLAEMGRVDLADPVSDYLDWVVTEEPITLRQLLAHRSGLKDALRIASIDLATPLGPQAVAQAAIDKGTRSAPGTEHALSATDYLLLGLVVEAELSQSYGEALHQLVLDPHGLGATWVEGYDIDFDGVALGHDGAGRERTAQWDPSNGGGALSVVSTTTDVERFLRVVFEDDTFLSEVLRLEFSFPADGEAGEHGFGFGVEIGSVQGEDAWSREGSHPAGYGAGFVYLPELQVCSVALTNGAPSKPGVVAELAAGFGADFSADPAAE